MNYITITTPENIEIEYRLAGLGSRLAAAFIDILIQTSAIIIIYAAVLFGVMLLDFYDLSKLDINGIGPALLIISAFAIYLGYYIFFEFRMNGQTPGKRLFNLRVIRHNGQPVTLGHSITRNILRYFIDITGVGVICILLHEHHKRIGDIAASTIVIAQNPAIDIINLQSVYEYNPDKFGNLMLNDDEYSLLVEFLARRHKFLDNGNDLRKRIVRYFALKFETPEYVITDEVLMQLAQVNRR